MKNNIGKHLPVCVTGDRLWVSDLIPSAWHACLVIPTITQMGEKSKYKLGAIRDGILVVTFPEVGRAGKYIRNCPAVAS